MGLTQKKKTFYESEFSQRRGLDFWDGEKKYTYFCSIINLEFFPDTLQIRNLLMFQEHFLVGK